MIHVGVFAGESHVSVGHACQVAGVHVDCDGRGMVVPNRPAGRGRPSGLRRLWRPFLWRQCHAAEQTDGLGPARGPGRATMALTVIRQRVFCTLDEQHRVKLLLRSLADLGG
jgi:hypothetical protein